MNRLFARGASVPVLQMGHAGLRQKSVPVSLSDLSSNGVLMNVQRMWKAMDEEQRVSGSTAVGLAAPQVGWHRRVVTLRGPPREKTAAKRHNDAPLADLVMVNPVLHVLRPQETVEMEESCLSVRGLVGLVTRSKYVAVEYVDLSGKKHTLECEGWYDCFRGFFFYM